MNISIHMKTEPDILNMIFHYLWILKIIVFNNLLGVKWLYIYGDTAQGVCLGVTLLYVAHRQWILYLPPIINIISHHG